MCAVIESLESSQTPRFRAIGIGSVRVTYKSDKNIHFSLLLWCPTKVHSCRHSVWDYYSIHLPSVRYFSTRIIRITVKFGRLSLHDLKKFACVY